MVNGRNSGRNKGNSNANKNGTTNNNNPVESAELSAEDYEIIAAGLVALGEIFSFLSLVKARQVTKETGGEDVVPEIFTLSTRKSHRRKSR